MHVLIKHNENRIEKYHSFIFELDVHDCFVYIRFLIMFVKMMGMTSYFSISKEGILKGVSNKGIKSTKFWYICLPHSKEKTSISMVFSHLLYEGII